MSDGNRTKYERYLEKHFGLHGCVKDALELGCKNQVQFEMVLSLVGLSLGEIQRHVEAVNGP